MSPIPVLKPSADTLPRPRLIPHSLELTVLFREFVHFWTGLKTEIPECKPLPIQSGMVEFIVRWNGSNEGALVLRTSPSLLEKLTWSFQDKGFDVPIGKSLFQEMATLYSIFLVHSMWMDEFFELGPILARPSGPKDWPSDKPHALCYVKVEGEPVEIRLWLGDRGLVPPVPDPAKDRRGK